MGGVSEGQVIASSEWQSVNDNVMGGVSEGEVWRSVNDNVMGGVSDGYVIPSGEVVHFWGELKAWVLLLNSLFLYYNLIF